MTETWYKWESQAVFLCLFRQNTCGDFLESEQFSLGDTSMLSLTLPKQKQVGKEINKYKYSNIGIAHKMASLIQSEGQMKLMVNL